MGAALACEQRLLCSFDACARRSGHPVFVRVICVFRAETPRRDLEACVCARHTLGVAARVIKYFAQKLACVLLRGTYVIKTTVTHSM